DPGHVGISEKGIMRVAEIARRAQIRLSNRQRSLRGCQCESRLPGSLRRVAEPPRIGAYRACRNDAGVGIGAPNTAARAAVGPRAASVGTKLPAVTGGKDNIHAVVDDLGDQAIEGMATGMLVFGIIAGRRFA